MAGSQRSIILGLGNTLNRDEGVGVHLLPLLQQRLGAQTSMEFVDGGTLGLNLLPIVEECRRLLLLDAVDGAKAPATVVELDRNQIPLFASVRLSLHQLTFQEVLGLAAMRGKLPEHMHLIGVQPADISVGFGMSVEVQRTLPEVLQRAEQVLRTWGMITDEKEVEDVPRSAG